MRLRPLSLVLAALPLAMSACADPIGPDSASYLTASIEGAVTASYDGTGEFESTDRRRPAAPPVFLIRSTGRGSASTQGFVLHRAGTGLPGVGSYPLDGSDPDGFRAAYSRGVGSTVERYHARSGELQVTAASAERIEGTFRFTAVLACTGSAAHVTCSVPPAADAPLVEVSGSFVAAPSRSPLPGPAR